MSSCDKCGKAIMWEGQPCTNGSTGAMCMSVDDLVRRSSFSCIPMPSAKQFDLEALTNRVDRLEKEFIEYMSQK